MTALPKKRLGRGLAALIGDDVPDQSTEMAKDLQRSGMTELPIEQIRSNNLNPRKSFNEADLEDQAATPFRLLLAKGVGGQHNVQPYIPSRY